MIPTRKRPELPPVLDRAHLAQLESQLGRVPARELLADGLIDITDRLARLEEALSAGDASRVGALAHEIAGAAGYLGLALMSDRAARADRAARGAGDVATAAAELLGVRDESLEALRRYCTPDPPGNGRAP